MSAHAEKAQVLHSVRAERGATLRCKGWRQEGLLRLLENNMENAEHPERLVVYGGIGKCARNWESYHATVQALLDLGNDETLAMQSGMPVAVFRTHKLAPRVVMANTNFMHASWETFFELQDKNLTMFSQYTAGPWQYIGTQGVIQGTFQTLKAIATQRFEGSLVGKILLTAGMGGMGGNQPRAMTMHRGVCVCADVDRDAIDRRVKAGYCDVVADSFEHAWKLATAAADERRPLGIAVVGNAVDVLEAALGGARQPDVVTDMTPCHDPLSYIPVDMTLEEAARLRHENRAEYIRRAHQSMIRQLTAMNTFYDRGVQVFEYGNQIRGESRVAGFKDALKIPGFVAEYIRPLFMTGRGPFRWICLSGNQADLARLDDLILQQCAEDDLVTDWIRLARRHVPVEGLPARVCYLGYGQRAAFGLAANDLVKSGEIDGPVAFSRDNLDSGSIVNPTFESENMRDGGDLVSDWPYLNALLNTAAMADLVAIQANYAMGEAVHTGVTMIADGTAESEVRLEACLTTDPGIGVVRHAQAGYESSRDVASEHQIKVPLWWSPEATFGPDE
jgi:urocanate hydratase